MIAPDVNIVDIDGSHWATLLSLLGPAPDVGRHGWLIAFVSGHQVLHAVRTGRGAIDPAEVAWHGPGTPLEPIRARHRVSRVLVLEDGVLPVILASAETLLHPSQDYVAQLLHLVRALRLRLGDGLWIEPRPFANVPVPSFDTVQRAFDFLLPDGRCAVFYVVDDAADDVHASLIVAKDRGDVRVVTTHRALESEVRLGKGWRRGYRSVLSEVRERFGPAHLGVFLEVESLRRIQAGPRGTFARELGLRHVVVDPAPAWFLTLLGGSVAYGMAENAAGFVSRFLPRDWRDRMRSATPSLDWVELLLRANKKP